LPFPPIFTNVWDTTFPPDTQLANLLGQDLRNVRTDVMQRLSLLGGTRTNRPTPEIVNATWGGAGFGLLYFSTDTGQIFQWNGEAWVDVTVSLIKGVVASVNLTAQQATIGITTLYTPPVNGYYRPSFNIIETQAATSSSTLPLGIIGWTDGDTGVVESYTTNTFVGGSNISNVPGIVGFLAQDLSFYARGGTNITYSTSAYASSGVTPMQFAFRLRLEFLG